MINVVQQVRTGGTSIGILSNTCAAHWEFISSQSFPILEWFELDSKVTVLSYQVGAAKPDPAIYRHAIAQAAVEPAQIFFVDDLAANVKAAQTAGIDAVLYTSTMQLIEDLKDRRLWSE